jgi:hypothetical protein
MEVFSIRRNFTERARRLISRNAGIAARVFDPAASAPEPCANREKLLNFH